MPGDEAISNIFEIAGEMGIQVLDTASTYGDVELKIAKLSNKQFQIITKFPEVKSGMELNEQLNGSLKRLNVDHIYGYLAHNPDTLIASPDLWDVLLKAKRNEWVDKIGYSLYYPSELKKLLELGYKPDLVQIPYSLLDRKFESYLPLLKNLDIEIHVRSVFLQGLYFMDIEKLPQKLIPLKSNLVKLRSLCEMYDVKIGALALNFVYENPFIDRVVIGVDSTLHLKQNWEMINSWNYNPELMELINSVEVDQKELLNPTNW